MKFIVLSLCALVTSSAFAGFVPLIEFDQLKLGELLGKLPTSVRSKAVEQLSGPRSGIKVKSLFPKEKGAFNFLCESTYYNGSNYASHSECKIEIDTHHEQTDVHYDEFKIVYTDVASVKALFEAIPYGSPVKEFRSTERKKGTNFEGKNGNIFNYYFKCGPQSCEMRFSHKVFEE